MTPTTTIITIVRHGDGIQPTAGTDPDYATTMGTGIVSASTTVLSIGTGTVHDASHNNSNDYGTSIPRTTLRTHNRSHARKTRYQHTIRRPPVGSKMVNLSNCTLSTAEISVLDKDLTFVPQSFSTATKQIERDYDAFARRLRIQYLYHDCPDRYTIILDQSRHVHIPIAVTSS